MVEAGELPRDRSQSVVVGLDGSDGATHALRWATNKAALLGEVTPVTSFQLPVNFDLLTRPASGTDHAVHRAAANARLAAALEDEDPALLERAKVIEAHPGEGLVEAAADADLLVVGTRGRNALVASWLGSVSTYCVNHATVPVAVIPPEWPADKPLSTIVVGVDGSDHAERALAWAIGHVEPDGTVLAVGCFSMWAYMQGVPDPPVEELEKSALKNVERSVAKVTGSSSGSPKVEIRIESRDPRVALPELVAAEADLLVVGARGVSGLAHLILGSVSSALIHHPTVATVIVQSGHTETGHPETSHPKTGK